jgi:hypothetical protein
MGRIFGNAVNPTEAAPAAATWARQPRMLAHNEADAVATIAATIAACLTVAGCIIAGMLLNVNVRIVYVAAAVAVEAVGVAVVWVVVYADALRSMNRDVRRATWAPPTQLPQGGPTVIWLRDSVDINGKRTHKDAEPIDIGLEPLQALRALRFMRDTGETSRRKVCDGAGVSQGGWSKLSDALHSFGIIDGTGRLDVDELTDLIAQIEAQI